MFNIAKKCSILQISWGNFETKLEIGNRLNNAKEKPVVVKLVTLSL